MSLGRNMIVRASVVIKVAGKDSRSTDGDGGRSTIGDGDRSTVGDGANEHMGILDKCVLSPSKVAIQAAFNRYTLSGRRPFRFSPKLHKLADMVQYHVQW
ncbi:hypothetical protein Tco_1143074 [Tanacetum coccineum]